ncbi:MAG: hypothetical protein NT007_06580 [Candidatus Kapabacteria bacterium]|nr:hypothetical protein [Candidatus Kapabacteria bacterium]
MSFLRMQESPSSATLGDSCIRRNDSFVKYVAFETAFRGELFLLFISIVISSLNKY